MISRRGIILAASVLALTLCSLCGNVKNANDDDDDGEASSSSRKATREHISQENIAGVFLFSLDGQSISGIDGDDFHKVIAALSNLDLETAESPATVPSGGVSGGRDHMFFVVFKSSATLTVGTAGACSIYDSVLYESDYDACHEVSDLYSKLIKTASF